MGRKHGEVQTKMDWERNEDEREVAWGREEEGKM